MKTLSLKTLLVLAFCFSGLFSLSAHAAPGANVNPLRIKGLQPYVGKYLTVYYALGKKASIATEASQVYVSEVRHKTTVQILPQGEVVLPRVTIPLMGVQTYNLIVFVIHQQPTFRWMNVNGQAAENEVASGSSNYVKMVSVSKADVDASTSQLNANVDTIIDVQLF